MEFPNKQQGSGEPPGGDDPELLYRSGLRAYQLGDIEQAAKLLEQAVRRLPGNADFAVNLGVAYRRLGRLADAEHCYRRALQLDPANVHANNNLGNVLRNAGSGSEAEQCYRRAIEVKPDFAEAFQNLGNLLVDARRFDEAEGLLRKALSLNPALPQACIGLGNALQNLRRYPEAVESYRRALASQPELAEAHSNMGRALAELGQLGEAEQAARRALSLGPAQAEVHNNLGLVLSQLGRMEEAERCHRRALALKPGYTDAINNLANTLHHLGRLSDAAQGYRDLLALEPESAEAHANLGNVLKDLGRLEEAERSYRQSLALKPDFAAAHSNLIFTLDLLEHTDLRQQQEERRRWYSQHGQKHAATIAPHENTPDPERRLRIGYVSADFRRHSAYYAFAPILLRHDRTAFDVVCYSGVKREDDATDRLRATVSGWQRIAGISDEAVAQQIRRDRVDILVDLSGHSAGNRLLVFARKPAPVQVTAWGHATGTGLATMDHLFADPVVVTQQERRFFAEEVVDLPCLLCYEPPEYLPAVAPLPAAHGNPLTYGCVNRLEKVTDGVIALWGRILQRAPGARLLIKDKGLNDAQLREQLLRRLEKAGGIGADRVLLHGASAHAEHLRIFGQVDIGLDPFPQSGGISTAEALCMGVPVVTLCGKTFPSRITASTLTVLDMEEWIAGDPDEYVSIALQAGSDLARLATLRSELRQRVMRSPFGDAERYTRAVEQIYRSAWRRWCARQKERPNLR